MKLSDAEWTVMNALWRRAPASARDVLEQVEAETDWAYTTVKTILARLVEKGIVAMRRRANTCLYEPRITREQARGSAILSLVEKAFDGAFGSLVQFLVAEERISPRDRQALSRKLRELEQSERRPSQ